MLHGASSDIKTVSRCIGIDDGPFPPKTDDRVRHAPLLAVWLKGPRLHQLRTERITVDGLDATRQAEVVRKTSAFVSRMPEPLRVEGILARALFSSEPPS